MNTKTETVVAGLAIAILLISAWSASPVFAQLQSEVQNGNLETTDQGGVPSGWYFANQLTDAGFSYQSTEDAVEGERAAEVDARDAKLTAGQFGNLMQTLDAKPYRGKRVRFRAAVKLVEPVADARAQLWFRVDRPQKDGRPQIGAFDNMQDRPIRSKAWKHFEIIADVEEDAERIIVGMLTFGNAKFLFDDASLEIVDQESSVTTRRGSATTAVSPEPPAPFFNYWLWLFAFALALMILAQLTDGRNQVREPALSVEQTDEPKRRIRFYCNWKQFGFRFAMVYWLCYSLPSPFTSLFAYAGLNIHGPYQKFVDGIVRWTAPEVLGIEKELVPPLGSGDTTYNYVQLFIYFVVAFGVAVIWSLVDWRKTKHPWLRDLLRSYLRYVLAMSMLGYGLAKVGYAINQFPEPGIDQLSKPYGDSSPMNLLWTFMGASRPYTIFAGLGEVVGALLLVWRRTAALGAIVVFGVMLNVVMLNFCYDVPVKQYSFHLWFMAAFLLLADRQRFLNLLIWNRPAESADLMPPYTGRVTIWVQRVIKSIVIVLGIAIPLGARITQEINYEPDALGAPEYFAAYQVEEFQHGEEVLPALATDSFRWKLVQFRRVPWGRGGAAGPTDYLSVRMMNGAGGGGPITLDEKEGSFELSNGQPSIPKSIQVTQTDNGNLILSGTQDGKRITVRLKRISRDDFLLVNRGFHWINETPFNR